MAISDFLTAMPEKRLPIVHLPSWHLVVFLLFASRLLVHAGEPAPTGKVSDEVKQLVEKELAIFAEGLSARKGLDSEVATELLRAYLSRHPKFYGAAFAFAPVEKGGELVKSSPYVYRHESDLKAKNLSQSYDYADGSQQWYSAPVKKGKPLWSDPYFDKGGGDVWMITYSIPIYRAGEAHGLFGVVTTDLVIPEE